MTTTESTNNTARATILHEALPLIAKYSGEYLVYKVGGSLLDAGSEDFLEHFAEDIVTMQKLKIKVVIVHGGGSAITTHLDRLGIESHFVNGMRVTDTQTMDVVEMVLSGLLNKRIVAVINKAGGRAIGISGKDGDLLNVAPMDETEMGVVARPTGLRHIENNMSTILQRLCHNFSIYSRSNHFIPVISPVSSHGGKTYNVNADHAASMIAIGLRAKRLYFLTDIDGVLDENGELIKQMTGNKAQELLTDGTTITDSMRIKLEASTVAVMAGVDASVLLNCRQPHVTLLESFTKEGSGTLITDKETL